MVALLYFSVDGIRVSLPLDDTTFLVRMVELSPCPDNRPGVIGKINLHGSEIPVFSTRRLFGLPNRPPRITDHLIITTVGWGETAIWVDETYVVQDDGGLGDISGLVKNNTSRIPGIFILPDGLVIIHDLTRFLDYDPSGVQTQVSVLVQGKKWNNIPEMSSLPESETLDPDQCRIILADRARDLAKPEEKPHEISSIEVLTFQLVYREYAVELKYVRESVLSREITPVPGTPEYVIGVLPVRGEIIPLIDLRVLLKIPETGLTDLNQVIVLTDGLITFGILADQITGIRMIPWDHIRTVDPDHGQKKMEYILGLGDDSLVVINAAEILADSDMIVDDSEEHTAISVI